MGGPAHVAHRLSRRPPQAVKAPALRARPSRAIIAGCETGWHLAVPPSFHLVPPPLPYPRRRPPADDTFWNTSMAKTPPKTTVSSEGLRYHSKVPGSPFVATGHFGAATMSCFLCGKHRPRAQLKSRKLMGKTHFVCAPSCKELEAQATAR